MEYPTGVCVDPHHIYIVDCDNYRVLVYSKQTGDVVFQMGQGEKGRGDTQFKHPMGVSVDSEAGMVYVADFGNERVCVYRTSDGSYVRHFQMLQDNQSTARPEGVQWDAGRGVLYVTMPGTTLGVCGC
eukprot:TRINITY_DN10418_c0_g1_i6.p2 TRINITY_DN10418_c0_g1~~TRINITY_DN10418_c0_g1_i6.p2  ORF type:complete len:128 (-),score=30.39 TRINITY_DN10418_c0_g1_i6:102-485(-)